MLQRSRVYLYELNTSISCASKAKQVLKFVFITVDNTK